MDRLHHQSLELTSIPEPNQRQVEEAWLISARTLRIAHFTNLWAEARLQSVACTFETIRLNALWRSFCSRQGAQYGPYLCSVALLLFKVAWGV